MERAKPGRSRRDQPSAAEVPQAHEPPFPLTGWPSIDAVRELTGADPDECLLVTIHGVSHYLHATTAPERQGDKKGPGSAAARARRRP